MAPSPPKTSSQYGAPHPAENAFTELGINQDLYREVGGVRVRQHVNPLKKELQELTPPPDWAAVYEDTSLPLAVDVGAGYGRFSLALKTAKPEYNMLGIEIRKSVIDRANKWAEALGLHRSVHFIMANGTITLKHTLASYPGGVGLVTIQYPDPHFKKRHRKRRIVQPQLVQEVASVLQPGGLVLFQSDVLEVAEDMRDLFEQGAGSVFVPSAMEHSPGNVFYEASPPMEQAENNKSADGEKEEQQHVKKEEDEEGDRFESTWALKGWLKENPLGVPTERELHTLGQGKPVYRVLLKKI